MLIREATTLADLAAMLDVFHAVWGPQNQPPLNVARAIQHAGGYAAIVEADGRVIAGSLGFLGRDHDGAPLLHSHITGALPDRANAGVGFALKQHQRTWCLERGIETITWTFDPLVRRNAWFNLTKLGAVATAYHADFYGSMDDALNGGDETDRLVATWRLREERVVDQPDGPIVLDIGVDGGPVHASGDGDVLRIRIPAEVTAHRDAWRRAVRDTLGVAINDGYVAVAMTVDGCYVAVR